MVMNMFDMEDLLKKVHMLWDLNNDINNRSNIIKERTFF